VAVVELRAGAGDGPVVAEWRRTLGGMQVPIRFEMPYGPATLDPAKHYALRAVIFTGGQPAWASDAKPVAAGTGNVEAGTLLLAPYQPLSFASTLTCGDRTATFGIGRRDGRDVPQLLVGDRRYDLREVVAASGARYEAIGDARTSVWNKGTRATVTVGGETWPECDVLRAGASAAASTLRARGNEPFWSLDIGATLRLHLLATTLEGPAPDMQSRDGVRRYEGTLQGRAISVAAREQRCADTMTGMPYPLTVEMQYDGRTWRGCGGNPADLLVGPEWVVEDITGGMVDRSRATLAFSPAGSLAGRASCNSYSTTYTLTGENLAIGKTATTRMACAPSLMQQEDRFLDILGNVRRFEISDTGALVLITADDRRITARRPK
jgi:heat shock protein HslJ/membrane-bound inhibitor of C-type lysozyme